jgi:hypothetical protein
VHLDPQDTSPALKRLADALGKKVEESIWERFQLPRALTFEPLFWDL